VKYQGEPPPSNNQYILKKVKDRKIKQVLSVGDWEREGKQRW
jgi:hypothetical protein